MATENRIRMKPRGEKNLITRQFEEIMAGEEDQDKKSRRMIRKNKENYGRDFI